MFNYQADRDAGIQIMAARVDGEFDNYKAGLENCITRDGQTPATADISLGGNQIANLGVGSADTDAVNIFQLRSVTQYRNFLMNPNAMVAQRGLTVTPAAAGGYGPPRSASGDSPPGGWVP